MEPILQSIFDSAVDGIIVIDAKGSIKAFNPAAERLFGYRTEEVLGHNVRMLMPSPDREQHDRYLANYLETGIPRIIGTGREVHGRRKDGGTFPLHLSVGQMELDGQPAFTGILHDLSRRVAIEEALRRSEERVRSIVESAVDGIIVLSGPSVGWRDEVARRQTQFHGHSSQPERPRPARAAPDGTEITGQTRRNGGGRCARSQESDRGHSQCVTDHHL